MIELKDIKYVMVTYFDNHWNKITYPEKDCTTFSGPIIKDGILDNLPLGKIRVETLFIKKSRDKIQIENCWIGISTDFSKLDENDKVTFRVEIESLKQVNCPPQFTSYPIGWHLNKEIPFKTEQFNLKPGFFDEMKNANAQTFEILCHYLLRLLGIHRIKAVPFDDNGGKEDGAFIIGNLAVLYDCTIRPSFLTRKKRQIKNYIQELKTGEVEIGKDTYPLKKKHQKQVWIITRNSEINLLETNKFIKEDGGVKVKEIPYRELMKIFLRRLEEDMSEEGLSKTLANL